MIELPPPPGNGPLATFLSAIREAFSRVVARDVASTSLLMQSPDGRVWELRVTDAGTVTATLFAG